jgi:hypothetical protein
MTDPAKTQNPTDADDEVYNFPNPEPVVRDNVTANEDDTPAAMPHQEPIVGSDGKPIPPKSVPAKAQGQ